MNKEFSFFKVSIITPSYNQDCFIERTINSVLSQNYPLDYWVIDGDSSDNTRAVLQKFNGKISWISEKDNGQADAINKGIKRSSGEIIGWLNSDDIYYPEAVKVACHYFSKYPDVDVLYGRAFHIDENDNIINQYETKSWTLKELKEICYICQPAVFFRRKIIEEHGDLCVNLTYCMDYEYWLRLAVAGIKFMYVPYFMAGSRLYPNNKTFGSRYAVHVEINDMMLKKFGKVPARWLKAYASVCLEQKVYKPLKFSYKMSKIILSAAWRWNKSFNWDVFRKIAGVIYVMCLKKNIQRIKQRIYVKNRV